MVLYLRLILGSFSFAWAALITNKLRTLLSLLGVTVGIFSIIAVLAAVDSMDKNIKSELSGLDRSMMYVFNHSFGPTDVPKWKIDRFPKVTYEEYDYLKRNLKEVEFISYSVFTRGENIKFGANVVESVNVKPCTSEMEFLDNVKIGNGRFFNEAESTKGAAVVVLGYEIANTLFKNYDPIGKSVRFYGRNFRVVGVVNKQGKALGGSHDETVFFPVNFLRQLYGDTNIKGTPAIVLKPFKGSDIKQFEEEIASKLRMFRGIKVSEENNFFINVFGGMLDMIDEIVGKMNVVGWVISGFSLLVGGFGIANIMFVSVKERTHLIGVQKAIGAKSRFIMFQFLFEAVILALIGGVVGLFLVWEIALLINSFSDFKFVLSFYNIVIGLFLSGIIGLISGLLPARSAAKLDPVEAIRMGG